MRFPEFSGEWEKCTLGSIGETFNGLTGKSAADFGSGSPYITYKSIFDNSKIDISKVEYVKITETERVKQTQNEVEYGDIFFTTSSETPEEVGMASVLLSEIRDCYLNSFCFGYRLFDKCIHQPDFFRFYLRSSNLRKKIAILAQGSTRFNISKNEVMKMPIFLPSLAEQRKISKILSLIEDRIETQRKIIEDLKKLKRAICDNCFSNGTKVKFGDLGSFIRGLSYSTDEVQESGNGTMVLRSNNIENGEEVNMDELVWVSKGLEDRQKLQYGDIVICMANGSSPLVGKASYFPKDYVHDATVGAFCGIFRPLSPAAKWLVQTKMYRKYIHQSIQGGNGAIANIYPQDILNMTFCIPNNLDSVTDALELLHERIITEAEMLKLQLSVKQHLLSQIFI